MAGLALENMDVHKNFEKLMLSIRKLGCIGGGKMSEAIVTTLVEQKIIPREKLVIADPNPGMHCPVASQTSI